jgi:hypothetical protein
VATHVLTGLADIDDDRAVTVSCGERHQGDFTHAGSFCQ